MTRKDKYIDLMQSIKADEEKEVAQNELTATLEQISKSLETMREQKDAIEEAIESGKIILKGLDAANASADNIIKGISSAIVEAQKARIKVGINDEGLSQLEERNNNAIDSLTGLFDKHGGKIARLLKSQRGEFADITSRTEGVHLSRRVFFWLGGIWFASIGIIIIELTLGILCLFGLME